MKSMLLSLYLLLMGAPPLKPRLTFILSSPMFTSTTLRLSAFALVTLYAFPVFAQQRYSEGFENPFVPVPTVPIAPNSPSIVRGQIPAGWTEDSTYPDANVSVTYSQSNDAAVGRRALRMDTDRVSVGNSGLRLDNLQLAANTFYRLKITARSAVGSSVELALRSAPPHKNYWSHNIGPGPEWKTYDFIVPPLATADNTAQFIIISNRPGQMDFDEFSLTPISEDEVGTNFTRKGNLLPSSSFPLGVTTPWLGTKPWTGEKYKADPAVVGPSGLPSLRIEAGFLANLGQPYFESLLTVAFVGKPNSVHTFSAWIKGAKNGQSVRLRLTAPGEQAGPSVSQAFTLTTEWKRYEFSRKLPYNTQGYYIAGFASNGRTPMREVERYWVDQAQVEVGDKAMPFQRPAPVEVALSWPQNLGLYFEDQPLRVEATAWGEVKAGTVLSGTFYDLSGQAFPVESQPLQSGRQLQTVAFSLPRGKEMPFGVYLFAAQAKNGTAPVSPLQEISLARVRRARLRDVFAPQSPFGVHAPESEAHVQLVQDLGFKWVRTWGSAENMVWSEVEQPDGTWDWHRPDRAVELFRRHKMSIMGVLGTHPKYSNIPDNQIWGNWLASVRPDALPQYEDYARRVATRYKGIIREWETHNETDLPSYFYSNIVDGKKVGGTGEEFARQHEVAYRGLKAADPNIRVWWNLAWARPNESVAFVESATRAGIWNFVDAFSYHQYQGNYHAGANNAVTQRIDAVRAVMPADKKQMTIWNSEGGFWPNEIRDETPQVPPTVAPNRNAFFADWVIRYTTSTLAKGSEKFFLFSMASGDYRPGHEVLNADGSVSQLLVANSNYIWHIEGKKFSKIVPLKNGLNAYLFTNAKSSVAVLLSSSAGRANLAAPITGVTVRDYLGNPVAIPARIGDSATFLSSDNLSATEWESRLKAAF